MPTQVPNSGYSATPFEEPIALKPFLKGIADAIREKKKTTELINAQNFRSEILSIQGGVNVVKGGGTVVPNSGYVEKIYFNTALSVEEVVNLCSLVANEYVILRTENSEGTAIYNIGVTNVDGVYGIINFASDEPPYFVGGDVGLGFVGWNPEFSGVIEINSEVVTTVGKTVLGAENDKLTSLVSIDGFGNKTIKTLEGDYQAVDIVVDELPSGPTPLENNLNVEKIYFNTNLTNEEVDAILDTLTLNSDLQYVIRYQEVEGTTTYHSPLIIVKAEAYVSSASGYAILDSTDALLYASNETVSNFVSSYLGISAKVGWNVSELEATNGIILDVGVDGDKLTQLFSATPFVAPNTIDLDQYLDNKQMPMSIKVNIESQDPNLQEKEITENGEYVADEGYDGFSKVTVNVASSGGGEDMLQARVDATNSCEYLFYQYKGDNVDFIKDLDTSNVNNMISMFKGCSMLKTIPQLDMIKVSNASSMFYKCSKLTNLTLLNIKVQLDLSQSENLTLESLINTVKELINVGSARIITMGTANLEKIASTYVKFTDSSVTTIPTNEKGDVVVCESTDEGAMLLKDYALLKNWTLA